MIGFDMYWASIFTIDHPTTTVKSHDGSQHAKLGNAMDVDTATAHLPTRPLAHARKKASHIRASGSWHGSRRRHVRSETVVIAKLAYLRPAAAGAEYLAAKPVLRSDMPMPRTDPAYRR
jgi:hypothetical protein